MPTYEYRCPKGHEFERFQRMSDEPVAACPECGENAERLLSAGAGFLFKGDGFYITDYRSDSYREQAKAEREAAGKGKTAASSAAEGGSRNGQRAPSRDDGPTPGAGSAPAGEGKGASSSGASSPSSSEKPASGASASSSS